MFRSRCLSRVLTWLTLVLSAVLLPLGAAQAAIHVNLQGTGTPTRFALAISGFAHDDNNQFTQIVAHDLSFSGRFEVAQVVSIVPQTKKVNWQAVQAQRSTGLMLLGQVSGNQVFYQLLDVANHKVLLQGHLQNPQVRTLAHSVSNAVFKQMTGQPGIFQTKIAYTQGNQLIVSDYDGFNPIVVAQMRTNIISPAWSPDGTRIAFTSFDPGHPVVYIQDISTAKRYIAAQYTGNNSAPAWSPDGHFLAVALSRHALSNIYMIDLLATSHAGPIQITNSSQIDTEPNFFPNGTGLVFTSDRDGSPQIYQTGIHGGATARITYQGDQNLSPDISPNGRLLSYVSLNNNNYEIAVQRLGSSQVQILTSGPNDLSPSFSGNSQQIMYVHDGQLAVVNADGSYSALLPYTQYNVSGVAWQPLNSSSQP